MFWRVQSYRENNHVNVQYQKLHGALYFSAHSSHSSTKLSVLIGVFLQD